MTGRADLRPGAGDGVAFPVVDGNRSTTATGRAVFADAARAVDPALARAVEGEADWRRRYRHHVRRLLEATLDRPDAPGAAAAAGLASLHDRFVFERDGATSGLAAALGSADGGALSTRTVRGRGAGSPPDGLVVPYRGERLTGDALHRRLDRWVAAGTVEPSFAEAVRLVMANPDWLDLSDRHVAVLGAAAEMGPLRALCAWGAHVRPVDLPRPDLWRRILRAVRDGRGTAAVPARALPTGEDDDEIAAVAGADLVSETPEVFAWLAEAPAPLTLGNYAYADGAAHVRAAVAVDALTARLADERPDVSLAVLATPTDVYAAPEEAVDMAQQRFAARQPLRAGLRAATRGRLYAPSYPEVRAVAGGRRVGIADCLVPQQGQNYALAKTLQRWRVTVSRAQGRLASVHVAPPTRTRSVLKNRVLAAAYAGAGRFGVEVFEPATSNTLMAALLVHDLRNPDAAANPARALAHPAEQFMDGANHGGLWRIPFAPRSILGIAVLLGLPRRRG